MAKFTDIFDDVTKQGRKIPTTEYLQNGLYPIIDQGHNTIAGYVNETEGIFSDVPAIIFGDHTRVIKYINTPCFLGADGVKLLKAKINSPNYKYLYYALSHADIPNTGYNRHYKWLKEVDIPIPTEDKQEIIVNVLDRVNAIIDLRKQQLTELDTLVKARFVEMFGEPECNTMGWPLLNISELCTVGSSKRIYQSEQAQEGIPFLRIADLTNLINTGTVTAELYIPEMRYAELQAQGQVPVKGDILITSRGTLGQCYIVKEDDRFYFQDGMISWLSKFVPDITPTYISYLFAMPGFRKQIDSMQAGSTVAYLSIAMIKKLKAMVPSVELQTQFAAFVTQVNQTKSLVQKALEEAQTLFDSLMQQYFG